MGYIAHVQLSIFLAHKSCCVLTQQTVRHTKNIGRELENSVQTESLQTGILY